MCSEFQVNMESLIPKYGFFVAEYRICELRMEVVQYLGLLRTGLNDGDFESLIRIGRPW